jgi:hypothetical protein
LAGALGGGCSSKICQGIPLACETDSAAPCPGGCAHQPTCLRNTSYFQVACGDLEEAACRAQGQCAWQGTTCKVACELVTSAQACTAQAACVWAECIGAPKPCTDYSESTCPVDRGCQLAPPLSLGMNRYRRPDMVALKSGFNRCILQCTN